jgi:hypothetical protein
VIATAAVLNLVSAANVASVLDWRYDASTERVLRSLAGTRSEPRPVGA